MLAGITYQKLLTMNGKNKEQRLSRYKKLEDRINSAGLNSIAIKLAVSAFGFLTSTAGKKSKLMTGLDTSFTRT
ncbi:hypothetical protein PoB_004282500 [Plakobranchus ocellatus]|uniref:Uncharacterized protein n=1 Tax=Plakobranchus ocellatus TaxID=259542 RepID=A0AAV4BB45_9GAST|nr:hypothetical protein PoB_004282500 [Plakobranchus ocellatus]